MLSDVPSILRNVCLSASCWVCIWPTAENRASGRKSLNSLTVCMVCWGSLSWNCPKLLFLETLSNLSSWQLRCICAQHGVVQLPCMFRSGWSGHTVTRVTHYKMHQNANPVSSLAGQHMCCIFAAAFSFETSFVQAARHRGCPPNSAARQKRHPAAPAALAGCTPVSQPLSAHSLRVVYTALEVTHETCCLPKKQKAQEANGIPERCLSSETLGGQLRDKCLNVCSWMIHHCGILPSSMHQTSRNLTSWIPLVDLRLQPYHPFQPPQLRVLPADGTKETGLQTKRGTSGSWKFWEHWAYLSRGKDMEKIWSQSEAPCSVPSTCLALLTQERHERQGPSDLVHSKRFQSSRSFHGSEPAKRSSGAAFQLWPLSQVWATQPDQSPADQLSIPCSRTVAP